MAEIHKLVTDIEKYLNNPNALRAEQEANGIKVISPDPEEQNLIGYQISKLDPVARLASLAWSTARILKMGPDFYRGTDGVNVYKGLKTVEENGAIATIRVTSMPEVELIARHQGASEISQDSNIKLVDFQDRPNIQGKEDDSMLTLAWEEKDEAGDVRLRRETIVFGPDGVFRERSFPRQDRFRVTTIRLPLSEAFRTRVENVLLGIQATVLSINGKNLMG